MKKRIDRENTANHSIKRSFHLLFLCFFLLGSSRIALRAASPISLPDLSAVVRTMVLDDQNHLWIGTWGSGIWRVENRVAHGLKNPDGSWPSLRCSRLVVSGQGMLCATAGDGLFRFDSKESVWKSFTPDPGVPFRYLHALWADNERFVIGSVGSGAAIFQNSTWVIKSPDARNQVSWVNDAIPWESGILVAGAQGLQWFDASGTAKDLFPANGDWDDPKINLLWVAPNGHLLVGTADQGVLAWDGQTWKKIRGPKGEAQAWVEWRGDLWLAAGDGLWRLRQANSGWEAARREGPWGSSGGLKSVAGNRSSGLFVGTLDGQIFFSDEGEHFVEWARLVKGVLVLN
jgi:ligand-binding sensor domain-containing protein